MWKRERERERVLSNSPRRKESKKKKKKIKNLVCINIKSKKVEIFDVNKYQKENWNKKRHSLFYKYIFKMREKDSGNMQKTAIPIKFQPWKSNTFWWSRSNTFTLGGSWGSKAWRLANIFLIFFLLSLSVHIWTSWSDSPLPFPALPSPLLPFPFLLTPPLPFFLTIGNGTASSIPTSAWLFELEPGTFLPNFSSLPPAELSELVKPHDWFSQKKLSWHPTPSSDIATHTHKERERERERDL